jgi:hypothetical protein
MAFFRERSTRFSALQVSGVAIPDSDTDTGSVPESVAERHADAGS